MFIKDLVMWCHYNVILENSDITTRPWQRLAISDNLNLLSAYVIWNLLVLNIKGKVYKIAIIQLISENMDKLETLNVPQNTAQKNNDTATPTKQKTGCAHMFPGRVNISCSTVCTTRVTLVNHPEIITRIEWQDCD